MASWTLCVGSNWLFSPILIGSIGSSTWQLDLKSTCAQWVDDDSHTWVSKEMKFTSTPTFHGVRRRFLRSNSATTRVSTPSTQPTTVICREMADSWNNATRLASFHWNTTPEPWPCAIHRDFTWPPSVPRFVLLLLPFTSILTLSIFLLMSPVSPLLFPPPHSSPHHFTRLGKETHWWKEKEWVCVRSSLAQLG